MAKWDNLTAAWVCSADIDTDTVLSEADVENHVTNGALDFAAGSTLNGDGILTNSSVLSPDWANVQGIPVDIADGDGDTQLTEGQVEGFVTNGAINLAGGSTVDGQGIVGSNGCQDGEVLLFDLALTTC